MNQRCAVCFLVVVTIALPSPAGQPDLLKAADKILFKAHTEGYRLSEAGDRDGCVRVLREGLGNARSMLKARPELQLIIQVELAVPPGSNEARKLIGVIEIVRHRMKYSEPLPAGFTTRPLRAEREQALGDVNALGKSAGTLQKSIAAYERLIAKEAQLNGTTSVDLANWLNNLGIRYTTLGEFPKALPVHERSVEILERSAQTKSLPDFLIRVGAAALRIADFEKAEEAFIRSGKLGRREGGDAHPAVARSLHGLAQASQQRARLGKALEYYNQCLDIYKNVNSEQMRQKIAPEWVRCLNDLAGLQIDLSDYVAAQKLLLQSRKLCNPTDLVGIAQCRQAQARLHVAKGEYDQAEKEYKDVIKLVEKYPAYLATCENGLANLYQLMDKHADAQRIYERLLKFYRAALGNDHPEVAEILHNLALLHRDQKDYVASEKLFQESIKIRKAKFGDRHPSLANSFNSLAALYSEMGKAESAKDLYQACLAIQNQTFGPDSRDAAMTMDNLGLLHRNLGDLALAEQLLRDGLRIRQAKLPKIHPDLALSYNHLALVHAAQGRLDDAGKAFDKDRRIVRQYVTRVLPMLTSTQQLRYLKFQEERDLAPALSLAYFARDHKDSILRSADWLLNGKAIAHQVLAESALLARGNKNPNVARLLHDLETVRSKLSRLTIIQDQKEYERLNREEQDLVIELHRQGSQLASFEPWVDFGQFYKRLPKDAAFIDIARFQPIDLKASAGKRKQDARYVAWITLPGGQVNLVDLGEARVVEALIRNLFKTIDEAPGLIQRKGDIDATAALHAALQPLAKQVLHPLLPHIGAQKRWILCPDGDLWLVPWNTLLLPGAKDAYAVEKHTISYVTSGRDLVSSSLPSAPNEVRAPVIFANPDFDLKKTQVNKQIAELREKDAGADRTRSGALGAILTGNVKRLEFSAAEAAAVAPPLEAYAGVAPEIYMSEKAIKHAVRSVRHPRALLLSTHGFCLPRSNTETTVEDNPLMRCGLLFAGCNDSQSREQGILTGLEVLDMDLRGCELVVLSACQTGLGETRDGEGVAGLRQCFQLAGADAVVASLWEVPDLPTALLMKKFFETLAKTNDKAEALAEAQRHMIQTRRADRGVAHPFAWAAFTLTGRGVRETKQK